MDLEVVGRHALLFDDDAMAAFVNSRDALVDWHSLSIDRYDVRHLLFHPPPPRKRPRHHMRSSSSPPPPADLPLEPELDRERFLDLPPPPPLDEQDVDSGVEAVNNGAYRAVAFSYGSSDDSIAQKHADAVVEFSGFRPPFPVPENLHQNLPPSEKVHQIIARTAMFVSKHGGQSEIILRVKQGDNPTFGFLMPDHHLHTYFRFLVDNQELIEFNVDGKAQEDENGQTGGIGGGGALSLLGSVYGSGEDEDGVIKDALELTRSKSGKNFDAVNSTTSRKLERDEDPVSVAGKDEATSKHPLSSKEKGPAIKRNRSNSSIKAGKTEADTLGLPPVALDKTLASTLPRVSNIESLILEPPSELKRVVDKIVEFILRNGREFESVLIEQDSKHGRFPFLLPTNKYHPYYLKVLKMSQELKLTGKSISEKDASVGHVVDKKSPLSKECDTLSIGSSGHDITNEYDRKEKFKMIIGKSKKDVQDPPPSKSTEQQFGVCVDAAAAAAILQAATRGIKNPSLGILSKTALNGSSLGISGDAGQASSAGTLPSSQPQISVPKIDQAGEPAVSVSVAKAIAKTAALAAASEADSSEAGLTKEQKLKAERLKRAKMFAALIKSGAVPVETEPSRGLSVEPPDSVVSGSGGGGTVVKEREGSSAPVDVDLSDLNVKSVFKEREGSSAPGDVELLDNIVKSEKKYNEDKFGGSRSMRSYRSRFRRCEGDEEEDEDEKKDGNKEETDAPEEGEEEERDHKHSRKRHVSHHSSHHSKDKHKHRKRHSSPKDRKSRHQNKHSRSSDDEQHHRHKHSRSSDDKHHHWRRHNRSSDDEHGHRSKSSKRRRKSQSEREAELEEGEISTKYSDQSKASMGEGTSREASLDLSNSAQGVRAPSQPSETTEISDDLRAKIRAMLLATL